MKTYVAPGKVLEYTAPVGGVVSGNPYLIGSLLVIATVTAAAAAKFSALVIGVVEVTKLESEAWTENAKIYWDASPGVFTNVASGNILVGVAVPTAPQTLVIESDADAGDLLISGNTLQVLAFANLAGATVTLTVNGTATVLTEGVDFDAETSDDVTATNLAAAIDAIVGVDATATTDTVTVTTAEQATLGRVRLDGAAR